MFVVQRNEEYCVLKAFAELEETPNVPGMNLPGLDIASLATGYGCSTANVGDTDELVREFKAALAADGPTVLVVPTQSHLPVLG